VLRLREIIATPLLDLCALLAFYRENLLLYGSHILSPERFSCGGTFFSK
jgi:hypothetical protein